MKPVALCFWVFSLFGQTTATLQTRQTFLEVRAGPTNPQLLSLGISKSNSWQNNITEKAIDSVTIKGQTVQVHWKFSRYDRSRDGRRVSFLYESASPKIQLIWEWKAPTVTGPIEHSIHIKNFDPGEIWIPLQDSFQFALRFDPAVALTNFYVEKGAGKPSPDGTHQDTAPVGYQWEGTSSTYAHPAEGQPREVIPFLAVQEMNDTRKGWYVGIEFSGRTRLTVTRDSTSLRGVVGLNPNPGPFFTRLKPQETFDTPTVFIGAFTGGVDALGNVLRPWVRQVLGNPQTWQNPHYLCW